MHPHQALAALRQVRVKAEHPHVIQMWSITHAFHDSLAVKAGDAAAQPGASRKSPDTVYSQHARQRSVCCSGVSPHICEVTNDFRSPGMKKGASYRRLCIFERTSYVLRCDWKSAEHKRHIVEKSMVAMIARKYEVKPNQRFAWRRRHCVSPSRMLGPSAHCSYRKSASFLARDPNE